MPPENALLLARISDARVRGPDGKWVIDDHGVERQIKRLRDHAALLRWSVGPDASHVVVENDVSAYKRVMCTLPEDPPWYGHRDRRPKRPEFWRAVTMLATGQADGMIALDLDRTCRDGKDLESLLDALILNPVPVESVTGTLRLASTSDQAVARILTAVANKSSADTARRVADARAENALAGKCTGGHRRFGWQPGNLKLDAWHWPHLDSPPEPGSPEWLTGEPVPGTEAAELRKMGDQVMAGVSLRQIAADLRNRQVPTSQKEGAKWAPATVSRILSHPAVMGRLWYRPQRPPGTPRTAASMLYTPAQIGPAAPWPAIFSETEYWSIRSILEDPSRRSGPGNVPKHLLSVLAACWRCNGYVKVRTYQGQPVYYCGECQHGSKIPVQLAEAWVTARITARLEQEDAADLLPRPAGVDTRPLERERDALKASRASQLRMHGLGQLTDDELLEGLAANSERLEAISAQLTAVREKSPLDGIAGRPDAARVWGKMPLGLRRQVIREMATVTMGPMDRALPAHLAVMDAVRVDIRG